MTILQFLEGPIAKMNLTMLISSSSYPKIIYGMPLVAKDVQIRLEFEFKLKLKFELNQKRKWKKKKKKKRLRPHGLASAAQGPSSFSTAQMDRAHLANATKKRKVGRAH